MGSENMKPVDELKEKIAISCKILHNEGHHDYIWGHVSARETGKKEYWMKPRALGFNEITSEDLVLINYDGEIIGGSPIRERHGEYPIHSEIYRKREDVNCIIHTHPFYATLLSALQKPIDPINNDGCLFFESLAFYNVTSNLITTKEQGVSIAQCLGNNIAMLMRNHGVVVTGKNVEEATAAAIYLERAAKCQILTMAVGEKICLTNQEVKTRLQQHFNSDNINDLFAYLKRRL